jgi:dihydrofolate reductase
VVISALILTDRKDAVARTEAVLDAIPGYNKYFEKVTKGAPVIMGRRTFEGLGHRLSNNRKIIITKSEKYHSSRAKSFETFKEVLEKYKKEEKIFVFGGITLFKEVLPFAKEIYKTSIMGRLKSDDYYPEIDESTFKLVSSVCIKKDEKNRFDLCVEKWVRIK